MSPWLEGICGCTSIVVTLGILMFLWALLNFYSASLKEKQDVDSSQQKDD